MILTKASIQKLNLNELTDSFVASKKLNKLLLVVPTNRKVRKLKKEIISVTPGKAVSDLNIETLGTLSIRLLKNHKNFIELSEAAATLFIKASSKNVELKYFSMNEGEIPRGTLEKVRNVISEYKRHNITPSKLRSEAEKLEGSEQIKALDIAAIYEDYNEKCYNKNAYEIGDVYNLLLNTGQDKILKYLDEEYPDIETIIFDGFDEFTSPEMEIINLLSEKEKSRLFINFDYYNFNDHIFSHLDKCYEQLTNFGFRKIEDTSFDSSSNFKELIQKNLFKKKPENKNHAFADRISLLPADNPANEIEAIAKEIKELILKNEVKPHQICVSFNQIQKYSGIIRDTFGKYKIPYNLTDRLTLENSMPVSVLVNFLEILENNFFHKSLFRALSSGFIDLGKIDYGNLSAVSIELNIIAGYNNWESTIKEAKKKLQFEEDDFRKDRRLQSFNKALEDIKNVHELLSPFNKELTLKEFYESLKYLAESLKIPYLILKEAEGKEEEYIKGFTYFFETIKEVFELIELEVGKDAKHNLSYYLDQIRTVCSWARFNIKERADYGIQITSNNEIRGLSFEYLFMAGLTDGNFPTKFTPEIFFSGSFAKKEKEHQTKERYLFYQTLNCWRKKLYLTYPQMDDKKELSVSNFLSELDAHFEISRKSESDFNNKIFSEEELQIEAGILSVDVFHDLYKDYLDFVKLNLESLKHTIAIENSRITGEKAYNNYKGFIELEESIKVDFEKFKEREYSISQLETFAACPFKFFVERILKLEIPDEPKEDLEAMELGSILHSILFRFFVKLRDQNIKLKNCSDSDFGKAEELLFNIAEEKFPKEEKGNFTFVEREKIFGLNGNKKRSLLFNFLEYERNRQDDFEPNYFELSFGSVDRSETDKELDSSKPIKAKSVNLRGKIDRVDINKEQGLFNIVDYKLSGRKPTRDDLYDGLKLQLPIYMYAVEQILSDEGKEYNPMLMQIFSLKQQEKSFGIDNINLTRKKLEPNDYVKMNKDLIESVIDKIQLYVEKISDGKFHLTENDEKACLWCNFKSVCRVKDILKK